jgi:hypothetical protein
MDERIKVCKAAKIDVKMDFDEIGKKLDKEVKAIESLLLV